jgi:hypothetical protein
MITDRMLIIAIVLLVLNISACMIMTTHQSDYEICLEECPKSPQDRWASDVDCIRLCNELKECEHD